MGVTLLVCACGRRLKVTGAVSGRAVRCPACGREVRVGEGPPAPAAKAPPPDDPDPIQDWLSGPEPKGPDPAPPVPPPPPVEDDEWNWTGTYEVAEDEPAPAPAGPSWDWPAEPEATEPEPEPEPAAETPGPPVEEDEWNWTGTYGLAPDDEPPPRPTRVVAPTGEVRPPTPPPTANPKPVRVILDDEPDDPDPWWPPRWLYPARSAEGLVLAFVAGAGAWVAWTLIPEYVLAILDDGEKLGVPTMGRLIALISSLPVGIASPLAAIYFLQYLARVLVAAADGEPLPPRPPDRGVDGLFGGLSTWFVWLALGLGVGLLPLAAYAGVAGDGPAWNPGAAAGLGLAGLAYATMALLLAFLHDDPLAASPAGVLGAIARLGPSFAGVCLATALTFLPVGLAAAGLLALRGAAFWVYVPLCLPGWALAAWSALVATHTLGAFYRSNARRLRWRRRRLMWGVA